MEGSLSPPAEDQRVRKESRAQETSHPKTAGSPYTGLTHYARQDLQVSLCLLSPVGSAGVSPAGPSFAGDDLPA